MCKDYNLCPARVEIFGWKKEISLCLFWEGPLFPVTQLEHEHSISYKMGGERTETHPFLSSGVICAIFVILVNGQQVKTFECWNILWTIVPTVDRIIVTKRRPIKSEERAGLTCAMEVWKLALWRVVSLEVEQAVTKQKQPLTGALSPGYCSAGWIYAGATQVLPALACAVSPPASPARASLHLHRHDCTPAPLLLLTCNLQAALTCNQAHTCRCTSVQWSKLVCTSTDHSIPIYELHSSHNLQRRWHRSVHYTHLNLSSD